MADNSAQGAPRREGAIDSTLQQFYAFDVHKFAIGVLGASGYAGRVDVRRRPVRLDVAGHVFDRLSDPVLLARGRENGEWLGESLRSLAARRDEIRAVRGVGYLWGIDVTRPASEIVASAREAGLLILTAGDYTLRLLPPLIATREDLAHGLAQLERALS